ncbi:MAG: M48 family metalloprotease [Acidobacteria bacterium]|nr:M48 family metalloprotease [Acidobacteriota bacterium]
MYEWLGICLALSALLTLNAAMSMLAAMAWRLLQLQAQQWPASVQAQWLFALRIFPGLLSFICVAGLLIPAYVAHEPRQETEEVTYKLITLTAISAAGLLFASWRGVAAWLATRKLINNWLANSEPVPAHQLLSTLTVPIPMYRLRHQFPVIAVVGTMRPRLFIADHLFDSLTPEELTAAIAHECGHLTARDNLKRSVLRICRDVLTIMPCGRVLDRDWAEASEEAADEFAVCSVRQSALDLASALVKIARLVPAGLRPIIPAKAAGVLLIGENLSGLARRVARLTNLASATEMQSSSWEAASATSTSFWMLLGVLLAAAVSATAASSLYTVHKLIEFSVSILQ